MTRDVVGQGRWHALEHLRWIDGDADVWSMLQDHAALSAIVTALADLAGRDRPDYIVGIESRGFVRQRWRSPWASGSWPSEMMEPCSPAR